MNGYYQGKQGPGRQIPKDRKQHIIVLLARMIHQQLATNNAENKESTAKKELEPGCI